MPYNSIYDYDTGNRAVEGYYGSTTASTYFENANELYTDTDFAGFVFCRDTFDEGVFGSSAADLYTYGKGMTLPTDVTRNGCQFEGWYGNKNYTGNQSAADGILC